MKTKNKYISPEIEIIEVELEGTMAQSPADTNTWGLGGEQEEVTGSANSKRRSLWGDE